MSTFLGDSKYVSKSTEAEQIAAGRGFTLLTEQNLDCVTGAGSKPGMVGDGRQFPQLQQMR